MLGWGRSTHSEQVKALEALSGKHSDELHFAKEGDLGRQEAGRI